MTFDQVIEHFGSEYELADALNITRQAVQAWHGQIPELRTHQIETVTQGKLKASELPTRQGV